MADFFKLYEENPSENKIKKIAEVLRNGGLVIYPTDTVYGLGCDINNLQALKKIAQIKNIKKLERAKLSFMCPDMSGLSEFVHINNSNFRILKQNLPGPFTFILPGTNSLPNVFKKKKTVGIRIPDNNICNMLLKELGNPIITTSIKDDDEVLEYTTDPELIFEKWSKIVDVVIDGGYGGNVPSTVVDLTKRQPEILREGKGTLKT
ncbi:MAG TPA: L-threonylcarbamoyladenylate synthase [Flavobacteriaceae bacterium]|nr:L-threonylcarbamoyladenylate synthase [Flavobacteriaceae bacterium]